MTKTNMPDQQDQKQYKRRRRRGRVGFWMIASILLLTGLFFLIGLSLSGKRVSAPAWVTAQVVKRVNAGIGNGRVTLGRLQFQVDGNGVPKLIMGDLGVFDDRGLEIVRMNDVGTRFSIPALLNGKIKPLEIDLSGAQMTLRRRIDGQFDISLGDGTSTTGTLPDVLDLVDNIFASPFLEEVSDLGANDLTITLEDARSGRLWQITDGALQIRPGKEGLDISVSFDVFNGTEELAKTVIGIRTEKASSKVSIGTSFENAAAEDLALQTPVLSFLGVINAPISGAVRAEFDAQGALETLAGTLEIGQGALQPSAEIAPVPFSSAKSYFKFDPDQQKIDFSEVFVESEAISLVAQGHAYLNDFTNGWPSVLVGQFSVSDLKLHPKNVFDQEIEFSQGAADFRLKLDPFSVDFGQFVLSEGKEKLVARGRISAGEDGWGIGAELVLNQMSNDRMLAFWPVSFSPNTRKWLSEHVQSADFSNVNAALRIEPGQPVRRLIGWNFSNTNVLYINAQPEIENASGYASIDGNTLTINVEDGLISPPMGGEIAIKDTYIQIPDMSLKLSPIEISIGGSASTTALLSLLNEPPFRILKNASFDPDVAQGKAKFRADIKFDLKRQIGIEDVEYSVSAGLGNIHSDKLIAGRALSGDALTLIANNDRVEIFGPVKLGEVAADISWLQQAAAPGKSSVNGSVEISKAFIKEFGIGLPESAIRGGGTGQFSLDLTRGEDPKFTLSSDLNKLGLNISQIGWNKPLNSIGLLDVRGTLGNTPNIDFLEIKASGLSAIGGKVSFNENGSMREAGFTNVKVNGWLDAPVVLRGRGPNVVPSVHLNSGTIDIRKTSFGGASTSTAGAGGPISLNLDRLIVSQGMTLRDFSGEFSSAGGLSGDFTANMNGKTKLNGSLVPDKNGTAVRIRSDNAGGVLRDAGVVEYANNGSLNLTLRPRVQNGVYDGRMRIRRTNVRNAPGMTDLLSAISIVGLLEQLSGTGILFEEVDAEFVLSPTNVRLIRSSAVGPSLGVSLDGIYDLTTSSMNMQGVVSPVYFLNGIGQIFSRRGEGLFGFNFRLRGSSNAPRVTVNPLSILTPGVFRDIFRSPPPKPSQ